jgi:hypothetical protein
MKDPANIETFRKCAGVVLNQLHHSFPCPISIDVFYIEGDPRSGNALVNYGDEMRCWTDLGNSVDSNPVKSEINVYLNTIHFLVREGYVSVSVLPQHGQHQRLFEEAVLTTKGLAVLGRADPLTKSTIAQEIDSIVREGKYEKLQDLVMKLLSLGAGLV